MVTVGVELSTRVLGQLPVAAVVVASTLKVVVAVRFPVGRLMVPPVPVTAVPISASKSGILTGRPVPTGDWVLLFRVEAPGRAPVQVRYSSGMARSGQKSSDKKSQEGHAHDHH